MCVFLMQNLTAPMRFKTSIPLKKILEEQFLIRFNPRHRVKYRNETDESRTFNGSSE